MSIWFYADAAPAATAFRHAHSTEANIALLRVPPPCGPRLAEKVPHGHWKTTTLIAALDHRDMRFEMTLDYAMNGDIFGASCRGIFACALRDAAGYIRPCGCTIRE